MRMKHMKISGRLFNLGICQDMSVKASVIFKTRNLDGAGQGKQCTIIASVRQIGSKIS